MDSSEIEDMIQQLKAICKRKPLVGNDSSRVDELLRKLKESGFTNEEISHLLGNALSVSTIKSRTTGIRVTDPSSKTDIIKVLSKLFEMGITLADVQAGIALRSNLDAKGVSLEEVSSLIVDAEQSGLPVKELVALNRGRTSSGLTFDQLKESLDFQSQMRQENLTLDDMRKIIKACKSCGGQVKALDAIAAYGSLTTLDTEVKRRTSDAAKLGQQVQGLGNDLAALETRKSGIESEFKLHDRLRGLGFDEPTLSELEKCTAKYGGPQRVFEAVNSYTGITKMRAEYSILDRQRTDFEAKRVKAEADHAHLQAVVDMCSTLLYKHKFSTQAILDIYALASKYGEPLGVIKAVEKYGEVAAMESDLEKLDHKRSALETRIRELEKTANDLAARVSAINSSVKKALEPLSTNVSQAIGSVEEASQSAIQRLEKSAGERISQVAREYEDYSKGLGELNAEKGRLDKEIDIGRIIWAALTDPAAAADFPIDWVRTLVTSAQLFCQRKSFNPVVSIPHDLVKTSNYLSLFSSAGVADLLRWASAGFPSTQSGGASP